MIRVSLAPAIRWFYCSIVLLSACSSETTNAPGDASSSDSAPDGSLDASLDAAADAATDATSPADSIADSASEADAALSPLTKDELAQKLAEAACAAATKCCKASADCVSVVRAKIRATLDVPSTKYDGDAAARCVAAYVAAPQCAPFAPSALSGACGVVVDGTKKPGEVCTSPEDCQRATLSFTLAGGFAGCGEISTGAAKTCVVFEPIGDEATSCSLDFPGAGYERHLCAPPLVCSGAPSVCTKPPTPAKLGDSCTGTCVEGAFCKSGKCVALPKVGEPCPDSACVLNASCTAGTCVKNPDVPPYVCIGFRCPLDGLCGS